MKQIQFTTERLVLRPLVPKDFEAWRLTRTQCKPKQNRWDHDPLTHKQCTKAKFLKRVKLDRELARKDDSYYYGIFEKETGRFVGGIDFDIFVRGAHQFANFGYQVCNIFWGKGYGREAARAGLEIGFEQLKLNRLEAAINFDNKKSIRLAKAIGMRKEGIKKRYWFENGEWVDHLIYVANPEDIGLKPTKPKK